MAFVSLDPTQAYVIGVYHSAQSDPVPSGYAVIADNDPRLALWSAMGTPAQAGDAYAVRLAAGIQIVSTASPDLDGTYSLSPSAQVKIIGISTGIDAGKGFPGGLPTFAWPDISGDYHTFTSITDWQNFAAACESYMALLAAAEARQGAGHTPDWPDPVMPIP